MADARDRFAQRVGQALSAFAIAFQQLVGHALRRFLAHAGQAAQGVDQLFQEG